MADKRPPTLCRTSALRSRKPADEDAGAAPAGRSDRSRTPPPNEEDSLDTYATLAYVQTLQQKITSLESSIKDTVGATVTATTGSQE